MSMNTITPGLPHHEYVVRNDGGVNPSPAPSFDKAGGSGGYVAMATVLVVGFIMLSAGMAVALNSINESQSSFAETQKEEAIGFVESCVQDALLRLNKNNAIPATITLPDGVCTVTINSQLGTIWDFTTTGTFMNYGKSIRVSATRTNTIAISSWLEI